MKRLYGNVWYFFRYERNTNERWPGFIHLHREIEGNKILMSDVEDRGSINYKYGGGCTQCDMCIEVFPSLEKLEVMVGLKELTE